ncbi:MAG: InlB B-repeat-containing protein [Clostridia bacterium]|nr:InlB B-repeat-containing protein [Clostridia bacterium]MBQ8794871.1 InlB B-repeat-containing protein [Clostridia bacterium]
MKINLSKKVLAFLLALMCLLTSIPFSVGAEEVNNSGVDVEIVSFMRGAQEDLRASELLEARVTGYSDNVQNLTYKWTNGLGTYLYVYNSHNMYYINNTDGEIEIYNSNIPASNNMAGRTYNTSYKEKGFCWAAVYGSFTSGTGGSIDSDKAFVGTITVEVYDGETLLARDTHTGKRELVRSGWRWYYQNTGIVASSLSTDMDDVTIGMFEGDTRNVKDLLGESAILHITCVESTVQNGEVVSGDDNIVLTKDGDYYITAKTLQQEGSTGPEGDAKVTLTIRKNTCKFHENTTATATTTVYIFKKPTTSTTAYTLTLTGNLDDRCTYFIGGQKGERKTDENGNEIVLFTGLNPNTDYEVEVRGNYTDENGNARTAYAYVYDTTKPVYNGTVKVYLNGTYNSAEHTADGTLVNIEDVTSYPEGTPLYAKNIDGTGDFIPLVNTETGVYSSILDTGSYKLYYEANEDSKIDDQLLTMHNADRTRYLFYNSVQYFDDETDLGTEYYITDSKVTTRKAPTKDGHVFTGWQIRGTGTTFQAEATLSDNISQAYVLEAQWEKGKNVYVNFVIDHRDPDTGVPYDEDDDHHNVVFDLMSKPKNSVGNYSDVFDSSSYINWDGEEGTFDTPGYVLEYDKNENGVITVTKYNATKPILTNVLDNKDYSVEVIKSGYELISVDVDDDKDDKIIIDVKLQYEPKNGDLKFKVKLDEDAKKLIKEHPEYKPVAVDVKVLSWYTSQRNEVEAYTWEHITQHHDTFVTLYLNDDLTEATGSYPVWMRSNSGNPFYYRIKVVSYVLANGRVLETYDVENQKNVQYLSLGERYLAEISAAGGVCPDIEKTNLLGAYFDESGVQQGELVAEISIKTHNVTFAFEDDGATLNGETENFTLTKQIKVPDLTQYVPTKDGGYVFDGWYLENGTKVVSGAELESDITLYASWKAPLTVEGVVSVAGYYYLDEENPDDPTIIYEAARTHAVTVNLQKILPNSYTETIRTLKVDVTYNDSAEKPMGTANYCFTEVPDDGHQYRILIQNPNYIVAYQNEPDSLLPEKIKDYREGYNDPNAFTAVFGENEPLVADVNAFMRFSPENFNLHYQVLATSINEGYRPVSTEILIHGNDGKSGVTPQNWPVITQMNDGNTYTGDNVDVGADGKSEVKTYPVWMYMPDGHTLYDYGVSLDGYKYQNGNETITKAFDPVKAPFYVYYNGAARYSAKADANPEHQTQLLTVTLAPKRYEVIFNMGFTESEKDYITDFKFTVTPKVLKTTDENNQHVVVVNENAVHETSHIWSYETDVNYEPQREGYEFLGWYDGEGEDAEKVTTISADTHENITLYARWKELFTVTFYTNLKGIDETSFRVYYQNDENTPDDVLTLTKEGKVKSFYDIPQLEYELNNKFIFKGWYLADGTPISWDDVYTNHTNIYAHWIDVNEVDKDKDDKKELYGGLDKYPEFDLAGVQIRDVVKDTGNHYGEESTGLRFVSILSENVYEQLNEITDKNKTVTNPNKAEYGYALAKTETVKEFANGNAEYKIQYNGENVNGTDTRNDYKYVQSIRCSGYSDHRNFEGYRFYTAVITYDGLEGAELEAAHNTAITARAYLRYTDANNLLRTYYNNYTGTQSFGGCSASFAKVAESFAID